MSEVVGNISGLPEKMAGNSDHPPASHSGRPENFAAISARRFNGVEHQRFSVAGEWRTGVIATGVVRECRQLSENGVNLSSKKIRAGDSSRSRVVRRFHITYINLTLLNIRDGSPRRC